MGRESDHLGKDVQLFVLPGVKVDGLHEYVSVKHTRVVWCPSLAKALFV